MVKHCYVFLHRGRACLKETEFLEFVECRSTGDLHKQVYDKYVAINFTKGVVNTQKHRIRVPEKLILGTRS